MVVKCLEFQRPSENATNACKDYAKCARQKTCPNDETHCFAVWQINENGTLPLYAGCKQPLQKNPEDECGRECIFTNNNPKRYYCCCSVDFCNSNFKLPSPPSPPPPPASTLKPPDSNEPLHGPSSNNYAHLWYMIPILLMVTLAGAYIFKYRKRFKSIYNGTTGLNSGGGSREMRNNNNNNISEISIFKPFRKAFRNGDNGCDFIDRNHHHHHHHHHPHQHETKFLTSNNVDSKTLMTNHLNHDANLRQNETVNRNNNNDKNFDLNCVNLLEIIGSGRFGTVHRAQLIPKKGKIDGNSDNDNNNSCVTGDSEIVAVKIIMASDHQSWLNEQQVFNSPKLKHPNILNYLYSDEHFESGTYWLIVEYASRGSLYSYLKENLVSWEEFLHISLGIVHGLSHLHEADIAHRDFKSKNVLLKSDLNPCITDFGVAAILDSSNGSSQLDQRKKYLQVGTPRYMAPEVLECSVTFTKASFTKIDVYALSLVLWELISRCYPLMKPFTNNHLQPLNFNKPNHSPFLAKPTVPTINTQSQQSELDCSAETDKFLQSSETGEAVSRQESSKSLNELPIVTQKLPPYKLPFEDIAGSNPDLNLMRQIVVVDKIRPILRDEWRTYPASEFCRAIEDGWEYDHDARISASCFVERVESLPTTLSS